MRQPPAVDWPVGDDRLWRALLALAWASAVAAFAAWLLGAWLGPHRSMQVACGVALIATLAAGMGWQLGAQPAGRLQWSGKAWWWQPATGLNGSHPTDDSPKALRQVQAQVDLQAWMLLRMQPQAGRPRWCTVRRSALAAGDNADGAHKTWALFRAAVYCPGA
jgi:hypothetical protein